MQALGASEAPPKPPALDAAIDVLAATEFALPAAVPADKVDEASAAVDALKAAAATLQESFKVLRALHKTHAAPPPEVPEAKKARVDQPPGDTEMPAAAAGSDAPGEQQASVSKPEEQPASAPPQSAVQPGAAPGRRTAVELVAELEAEEKAATAKSGELGGSAKRP